MMRPSTRGYIQNLLFPAIAIVLGLAIMVDPTFGRNMDAATRVPAGLFVFLAGAIPAVFVLGMSVELDSERLTKVYFFELVRESIPVSSLAATTEVGRTRSGRYEVMRFMNVDGPGRFQLMSKQRWPEDKVVERLRLAPNGWALGAQPQRQHAVLWVVLGVGAGALLTAVLVWYVNGASAAG